MSINQILQYLLSKGDWSQSISNTEAEKLFNQLRSAIEIKSFDSLLAGYRFGQEDEEITEVIGYAPISMEQWPSVEDSDTVDGLCARDKLKLEIHFDNY